MKNLYPKGKGKIHPTPSSPSPSSVLNLLPAAILTLVSALSPQETEVLAYLIFHSIKTDLPPSIRQHSRKKCKKAPLFECTCFDCYTSFWTRWDSSPNRDLIHQAIEAFEEHLSSASEPSKKTSKGKKKDRRVSAEKLEKQAARDPDSEISPTGDMGFAEQTVPDNGSESAARVSDFSIEVSDIARISVHQPDISCNVTDNWLEAFASVPRVQESHARGLVRKVWPDVLGLFNSRLWSLWSPGS